MSPFLGPAVALYENRKTTMNRWCFSFLFCFAAATAADGPFLSAWREIDRDRQSDSRFSVAASGGEWRVIDSSFCSDGPAIHELLCDSTGAVREWRFRGQGGTDLAGRRSGCTIALSGAFRGKPVDKKLTIDNHPWFQIVPLGMPSVVRDSAGRSRYWAISLRDPAMLKAVCFSIVSISDAPLPGAVAAACRRVRVKIESLPAGLWNGNYYMRASDNAFVHYEGFSFGSRKPSGTIDAVNP